VFRTIDDQRFVYCHIVYDRRIRGNKVTKNYKREKIRISKLHVSSVDLQIFVCLWFYFASFINLSVLFMLSVILSSVCLAPSLRLSVSLSFSPSVPPSYVVRLSLCMSIRPSVFPSSTRQSTNLSLWHLSTVHASCQYHLLLYSDTLLQNWKKNPVSHSSIISAWNLLWPFSCSLHLKRNSNGQILAYYIILLDIFAWELNKISRYLYNKQKTTLKVHAYCCFSFTRSCNKNSLVKIIHTHFPCSILYIPIPVFSFIKILHALYVIKPTSVYLY